MLSQTTEYALRAVVYLASCGDAARTTQQIATATRVPSGYLAKVLQALARDGVVVSQRGLHGGFRLGRDADKISVLDVVNVVEPIKRITTCPLGLSAHGTNLCLLHRQLDNAIAQVESTFAAHTIAHLLEFPAKSKPMGLCPPPRKRA